MSTLQDLDILMHGLGLFICVFFELCCVFTIITATLAWWHSQRQKQSINKNENENA